MVSLSPTGVPVRGPDTRRPVRTNGIGSMMILRLGESIGRRWPANGAAARHRLPAPGADNSWHTVMFLASRGLARLFPPRDGCVSVRSTGLARRRRAASSWSSFCPLLLGEVKRPDFAVERFGVTASDPDLVLEYKRRVLVTRTPTHVGLQLRPDSSVLGVPNVHN